MAYFLVFPDEINYFMTTMAYVLVILATLIGLAGCAYYCRNSVLAIIEKNKNEPKAYKRVCNHILNALWYGYLTIFFIGLTVNNLFF